MATHKNPLRYINDLIESRTLTAFQKEAYTAVLDRLCKKVRPFNENVISEVFNRAAAKIANTKTFDATQEIAPWAATVAQNEYFDYLREEDAYNGKFINLDNVGLGDFNTEEKYERNAYKNNYSSIAFEEGNAERTIISAETCSQIMERINSLSEIDREIIRLRDCGAQAKDIAEALGLTERAVTMRVFHLKGKFEEFRSVA